MASGTRSGHSVERKPGGRLAGAWMPGALLMVLWMASWPAGAAAECTPGKGPNACKPNTSRCFDERTVQVCNPDTCVWDMILPCNNTEICETGKCVLNPIFAPLMKGAKEPPAAKPAPAPAPATKPKEPPPPPKPAPAPEPASSPKPKEPPPPPPKPVVVTPTCKPTEMLKDGECVLKPVCQPGTTESRPCNPNACPSAGSQSRACSASGQWGAWEDCRGCSGTQCVDDRTADTCTAECVWAPPKRCGSHERCLDGACIASGAIRVEREVIGESGRLAHAPMTRRSGQPIVTNEDLHEAIASGEIELYEDRTEVSVVDRPSSAWETFTSVAAQGTPQGTFISMTQASCERIRTAITNRYVKITKASKNFPALPGSVFQVTYDYIESCNDCWGAGPCFAINAPEIIGIGEADERVKNWEWSLFDKHVVLGNKAQRNEIAINPQTGEITGLPGGRVSYYYKKEN